MRQKGENPEPGWGKKVRIQNPDEVKRWESRIRMRQKGENPESRWGKKVRIQNPDEAKRWESRIRMRQKGVNPESGWQLTKKSEWSAADAGLAGGAVGLQHLCRQPDREFLTGRHHLQSRWGQLQKSCEHQCSDTNLQKKLLGTLGTRYRILGTDPALFVSGFQNINNKKVFLFITVGPVHQSSKITSHEEVTKQLK